MLHQFCEQEKNIGLHNMGPLNIPLLISVLFTSMALSSPWRRAPFRKESGDPEQIKAALEEAKRAGADEASGNGPVGDFSVPPAE